MIRPALLILDPDTDRRREVSTGLAQEGYEAVPATSVDESLRYAQALEPRVVLTTTTVLGTEGGALASRLTRDGQATLVVLDDGGAMEDLGDQALVLSTEGLAHDELSRRLRLALVGWEVGIDADLELRSLVGEIALLPVLEVVRSLHRVHLSGALELGRRGAIAFVDGQVVAARAGKARGAKAFLRLSRLRDGTFRVHLRPPSIDREMELGVDELVLEAVEEAQVRWPDPRTRLVINPGVGGASAQERRLLEVVDSCANVGELLDALPATDGKVIQALDLLTEKGAVTLVEPRVEVQVVTDSTADLPPDMVEEYGILVVPLFIHFGSHAFRDGVDIQPRDFYQLLESSDDHPSTQPPPQEEFHAHFHDLVVERDIISIHISEKLSQTIVHARRAALEGIRTFDHLPKERHNFALEVVDSQNVSMSVGLLAIFAARMARRGHKVFAISQMLAKIIPRLEILFVVDTFDFLVRGGRIGRARAIVGKWLGIKPILGVVDGEVAPVDRVRGGQAAQRRIVQLLEERLDTQRPVVVVVAHARAPVWAERLRVLIEQSFTPCELIVTDIGPVVGTHAGPGCVGCVVFQPDDDEWQHIAPLGD